MTKPFVVLLTGLPGSGKSTLAEKLIKKYGGSHINADEVRAAANDWDFSTEGRRRQFERMRASTEGKEGFVFLDFVPERSSGQCVRWRSESRNAARFRNFVSISLFQGVPSAQQRVFAMMGVLRHGMPSGS